jgi:hypothetical protein
MQAAHFEERFRRGEAEAAPNQKAAPKQPDRELLESHVDSRSRRAVINDPDLIMLESRRHSILCR